MPNIPLKPKRGKAIYCIIDNCTGEVLAVYHKGPSARAEANADCKTFGSNARVETYAQRSK